MASLYYLSSFIYLILSVNGKLMIDRLDQLETNMVSPHQEPPPSVRRTSMRERDWVKISESPPLIVNTRLGERVEIECEAIGSPAPEIQWFRGERQVRKSPQSGRLLAFKAGLAKTKSRLVIDCVTRKDEGFYACSSSAGDQSIKAQPTLVLIDGIGHGDLELCSERQHQQPRITNWTPTAMENMGFDVVLPCSATGNPAPSIYWVDSQNNVLNSVRHQVSDSGDLTIINLAWPDMGEYTCIAENSKGRDSASTFVYPVLNQK